jgi:hypothetical protein
VKKVLYSNGCSHTAGAEITKPGSCTALDRKLSFSGQLASRWNLLSINDAEPGQGNYAIVSQTIFRVSELLEKYKPNEIIVLIGWSGLDRVDFVMNNSKYKFCSNKIDDDWPNVVKEAWELWVLSTNTNVNLNKFSLYYFTLVNFLESYNIEYYMFNAVNCISLPTKNVLHANHKPTLELFDNIKNNNRYMFPFDEEYIYHVYIRNSGFDGFVNGRSNHFLESAHIYWANFITSYILKHNYNADWISDKWVSDK